MEWNRLKVFYYVGTLKSFSQAGEKIGIAQSAISRTISLLEYQLKTTLFNRHPAGISFTKSGEKLYDVVKTIFFKLEATEKEILEDQKEAKGLLRLAINYGLFNFYLLPLLKGFLETYPHINLRICVTDDHPQFKLGQVDVAIAPYMDDHPDLIQKKFLTNHALLYASPEYLNKKGIPQKPEDLDHHQLIGIGDQFDLFEIMNWHLTLGCEKKQRREAYITVNTPNARLLLAEQGFGITAISQEHPGLNQMDLVQVLPHIQGPILNNYIIYPQYMREMKRVKAFESYFLEHFNSL